MSRTSQTCYDSHRQLREYFTELKSRNPRYSLRSFASKLKVSPATLSEIFSQKRPLTQTMAIRFAEKLKFDPLQTQLFIRGAIIKRFEEKLPLDQNLNRVTDSQFEKLNPDTFQLIANWYYYALLSLLEIPKISTQPDSLAKRLGIQVAQVKIALTRLEKLKLIEKKGGRFVLTTTGVSIETLGYDSAMRQFLEQNLEKAKESLLTVPAKMRELSLTTMAIDPDKIPEARETIKRFRREMSAFLESGKKKRVYSLAVQLFPLDKEEK